MVKIKRGAVIWNQSGAMIRWWNWWRSWMLVKIKWQFRLWKTEYEEKSIWWMEFLEAWQFCIWAIQRLHVCEYNVTREVKSLLGEWRFEGEKDDCSSKRMWLDWKRENQSGLKSFVSKNPNRVLCYKIILQCCETERWRLALQKVLAIGSKVKLKRSTIESYCGVVMLHNYRGRCKIFL